MHSRQAGADSMGLPLEPTGVPAEWHTRAGLAGWIMGVRAADADHGSTPCLRAGMCDVSALAGRLP
jgi:hypothetical protein